MLKVSSKDASLSPYLFLQQLLDFFFFFLHAREVNTSLGKHADVAVTPAGTATSTHQVGRGLSAAVCYQRSLAVVLSRTVFQSVLLTITRSR